MPHQCTNCDRTFGDGSKDMLGGCPNCGGNKFQFLPAGAFEERTEHKGAAGSTTDQQPGDGGGDDIIEAPVESVNRDTGHHEDGAQASARRTLVTKDDLPTADEATAVDQTGTVSEDPDPPDLRDLREELNEQFESIKILRPGEYELNLMELYDREEYIIALEEDGRYVIDVPDTWRDED